MNTEIERFWSRVEKTDKCWLWKSFINHNGYGIFHFNGKTQRVHRISFSLLYEIPAGINVLHKCDVRNCVNPEHLFLGTQKENVSDCIAKGRFPKAPFGELHSSSVLTEKEVMEMRRMHSEGTGFYRLGKKFGVSKVAARKVVLRKTWKHVA